MFENVAKIASAAESMSFALSDLRAFNNYNGTNDMLGNCEQVSDLRCNLTINAAAREVLPLLRYLNFIPVIVAFGIDVLLCISRSATVFKLDSLLQLSDTCARNNKMTLMHYLCKVGIVAEFDKDLVHLEATSKIQLKSLAEEMQAVSKGLEKVEQEFTASENDGAIFAGFQKIYALKNFLDTAEAEVRSPISLYSEVFTYTFILLGRSADSLSQYFGENPARCPFEQANLVKALQQFTLLATKFGD
ncbi:hypothetical protein HYC85_026148 [Camellia sinensis]|uniref:FH2 domain-containing protein n=1 Tax=Camellia sinensis TaxID=4442 RepID=A0A7J7G2V8_CAMSI|nr:hypothetical protein HYC85_026148 [Camellia sinensis]